MASNPMLDAALEYVAQGHAVFLVKAYKTPLTPLGLKDATKYRPVSRLLDPLA